MLILATVGMSLGCGGNPHDRYEPAASAARQAVDSALSTWKAGTKYGPIKDDSPEINVFDARWQAGKKLESYEILEEVKEQPHPQFKVRIKLAGKPEEINEYLVVGIDPLLVFRDTDYKKASGM
jgi:hypothetical protein